MPDRIITTDKTIEDIVNRTIIITTTAVYLWHLYQRLIPTTSSRRANHQHYRRSGRPHYGSCTDCHHETRIGKSCYDCRRDYCRTCYKEHLDWGQCFRPILTHTPATHINLPRVPTPERIQRLEYWHRTLSPHPTLQPPNDTSPRNEHLLAD